MPTVALQEFWIMSRGGAQERNAAPSESDQVLCCQVAPLEVVRADGQARLSGLHGAPQHEVGSLLDQPGQAAAVLNVIAVAEENEAVGFARVGIVLVPLARLLLN